MNRKLMPQVQRAIYLLSLCLVLAGNAACTPTIVVARQKELVISQQSKQRDEFVYQEPSVPVDLVFVVDTTATGYVIEGLYNQVITKITEQLRSDRFRRVDYRFQVVSTPTHQAASVNFDRSSPACFFVSLFGGSAESLRECGVQSQMIQPRRPDRGVIRSLRAASAGVSRFVNREAGPSPVYIVFLQGSDSDRSTFAGDAADLALAMAHYPAPKRFFKLVRKARNSVACENPLGRMLAETPTLDTFSGYVESPSHFSDFDLCRTMTVGGRNGGSVSVDASTLAAEISQSLAEISSEFWLSKKPYQPEAMTVSSLNTLFRYGDDFTYDAASGRIVFSRTSSLRRGDQIDATYYTSPPSDEIWGTPPPIPR